MPKRYLFDTDVLIAYLRGYPQAVELLKNLAAQQFDFLISPVTVIEIEAGIRDTEKAKTYELLDIFEVCTVDRSIAHLAGSFFKKISKERSHIGAWRCDHCGNCGNSRFDPGHLQYEPLPYV